MDKIKMKELFLHCLLTDEEFALGQDLWNDEELGVDPFKNEWNQYEEDLLLQHNHDHSHDGDIGDDHSNCNHESHINNSNNSNEHIHNH
jgi:hypothetical protein